MTEMIVVMVLLVLLMGALLAATPWLMPPTECFSITVPPSARQDPRVRGYHRSYALGVCLCSLVCALAWPVALTLLGMPDASSLEGERLVTILSIGTTFTPIAASFGLMLHFRSRMRALKASEGWAPQTHRTAAAIGEDQLPQPVSLVWNLLYALIAAIMVVFALTHYDQFPSQIPMQMALDGTVTRTIAKSHISVLFPAVLTVFMGTILSSSHWMILRSKRPVDPEAPATSSLAYESFARAQSIVLLGGGLVLCAGFGVLFYLSALGTVSLQFAALGMCALTVAFAAAMLAISLVMGQSGGRLAARLRTSDEIATDDDRYWILGTIYCNADDPSIIVPKRFGVGWTMNIARPEAWCFFAAIALFAIGFVVLTLKYF